MKQPSKKELEELKKEALQKKKLGKSWRFSSNTPYLYSFTQQNDSWSSIFGPNTRWKELSKITQELGYRKSTLWNGISFFG